MTTKHEFQPWASGEEVTNCYKVVGDSSTGICGLPASAEIHNTAPRNPDPRPRCDACNIAEYIYCPPEHTATNQAARCVECGYTREFSTMICADGVSRCVFPATQVTHYGLLTHDTQTPCGAKKPADGPLITTSTWDYVTCDKCLEARPATQSQDEGAAEVHARKRRSAFYTKFAYPVTDKDGRRCLTCEDEQSPLWRTYFQGTSIPAFMCVLCIQAAYNNVAQFLAELQGEPVQAQTGDEEMDVKSNSVDEEKASSLSVFRTSKDNKLNAGQWFDNALRYLRGDPALTDLPWRDDTYFADFIKFWDSETPEFRSVVGSVFRAAPSFDPEPQTLRAAQGDGVAGLVEIDPGHVYQLPSFDGGSPQLLVFMKREGEGYPFNVGHHPGTNCQSVERAQIARIKYLQRQEPCEHNERVLRRHRENIYDFELRAAERHERTLPEFPIEEIETQPTCNGCGHIGCEGNHKQQPSPSGVLENPERGMSARPETESSESSEPSSLPAVEGMSWMPERVWLATIPEERFIQVEWYRKPSPALYHTSIEYARVHPHGDQELPDWSDCERSFEEGKATPLQVFIHNNEPAGEKDAAKFRSELAAVLPHGDRGEGEVEAALSELREMFPNDFAVQIIQRSLIAGLSNVERYEADINIGGERIVSEVGPTPSGALRLSMQKVREWATTRTAEPEKEKE